MRHLTFALLFGACSAPVAAPDAAVFDAVTLGPDGQTEAIAIEWRCERRCDLPGDPWPYQDRLTLSEESARFWRTTNPSGGYEFELVDGVGSITLAGLEHTLAVASETTGCIEWLGRPRPNPETGETNRWCFSAL